jgi:putrescine transport system permease protein
VTGRRPTLVFSVLAFGYAFLYAPIVSLIVYSFNESRLVTVWAGFSTRWYESLLHNEQLLGAAGVSLRVAVMNATLALVLGTLAGIALVRFRRFRGRTALALMVGAPLVVPDVILGLASLLLFVAMEQAVGWPAGRGMTTITIAHVTFSLAYVAIVVQSRLVRLDPSLEEAALDLGARPWKVFFLVTLPLIAPALAAGWLLAFTLSLDDLVIASFVSGPGASTLPMLIFSKVKLGVTPDINALATLIIAVVSVGVLVAFLVTRRRAAEPPPG